MCLDKLEEFLKTCPRIIKNKIKFSLFSNSDFIHFNFGPIAIANKNGTKNGIINLLQNGGPTDIFSEDNTSKNIG